MKSILVTGIGGVVGQGILRNLHAMQLGVPLIGTNSEPLSAGNHLCDRVHTVPLAGQPGHLAAMQALVQQYAVGLVIPGTDYEAHALAMNRHQLGTELAASPSEVTAICLDKYLNFQVFEAAGIPFAPSCLPSQYAGQYAETVVKPREGRGSRNVHFSPESPGAFADDYVVQQLLEGPELTTAFYVRQDGALHGAITLRRELVHGNTMQCEVTRAYDPEIGRLIECMIARIPFRGSCNVQSRATAQGIVPFEINCRISGTNSIRAQFGFADVAYTVQELFLGVPPDAPQIRQGCALRMMVDVIYPDRSLAEVSDRRDRHFVF